MRLRGSYIHGVESLYVLKDSPLLATLPPTCGKISCSLLILLRQILLDSLCRFKQTWIFLITRSSKSYIIEPKDRSLSSDI